MALIKCSECGKEISDKAASCPGCGYPTKNNIQNKIYDVFFVIMIISMITTLIAFLVCFEKKPKWNDFSEYIISNSTGIITFNVAIYSLALFIICIIIECIFKPKTELPKNINKNDEINNNLNNSNIY